MQPLANNNYQECYKGLAWPFYHSFLLSYSISYIFKVVFSFVVVVSTIFFPYFLFFLDSMFLGHLSRFLMRPAKKKKHL